jgi:cyclopropane fatty-acyl-phospholipid synthase-like methyltransferase
MPTMKPTDDGLGLGLRPGDPHYRAFVGPPADYDLVAAMSMGLLTTLGLRQHHAVLDIGCGSLRIGRLLVPYLNRGGYTGLEPNEWLVRDGIANELGEDQVRIKQPHFEFSDSPARLLAQSRRYDFILAQSIFSHTGIDLLHTWLEHAAELLQATGVLVATFLPSASDAVEHGWIYPGCVSFKPDTMADLAARCGLQFLPLDWKHPRQSWAAFAKPGFGLDWFRDRPLSWNACFERIQGSSQTRGPAA